MTEWLTTGEMKNKYRLIDEYDAELLMVHKGEQLTTSISRETLDFLSNYKIKWYAGFHKPTQKFYVQGWHKNRVIKLHRFIKGSPEGKVIDHFNGNTLDNRLENLRVVTKKENNQNRKVRRDSNTGIRNVYFDKEQRKYRVLIDYNGKRHHLGRYNSLEEAEKVAANFRKERGFSYE